MLAELFDLFIRNALQLPQLISRFELTLARLGRYGYGYYLISVLFGLCQAVDFQLLSSNSASTVTGRMCLEKFRRASRAGAVIDLVPLSPRTRCVNFMFRGDCLIQSEPINYLSVVNSLPYRFRGVDV